MLRRSGADLGIVVDTDVDRSAVVGSNGQAIAGNRYIALMASIVLRYAQCLPCLHMRACVLACVRVTFVLLADALEGLPRHS